MDRPRFRFLVALALVALFLVAIALAEQDSEPLAGSYQPTVANEWWGHWRRGETLLNLNRMEEAKKSMALAKKLANQAFRKNRKGQEFLAYVANFEGNQFVSQGDALSVLDGKRKMENYQKARGKYQDAIDLQQQAVYYVNRSIAIRRYVRTYVVLNKEGNRSDLDKAIASLDTAQESSRRALRISPELEAAQTEVELADLDREYYYSMLGSPVDFRSAPPSAPPEARTLEEAFQKIIELEERLAELERRLGK